jgi:hypothetical protein
VLAETGNAHGVKIASGIWKNLVISQRRAVIVAVIVDDCGSRGAFTARVTLNLRKPSASTGFGSDLRATNHLSSLVPLHRAPWRLHWTSTKNP